MDISVVTWSITDICGCRYLRIVDGRVGYLQVTVTYVPRCSRHFPCVIASEAVLAWPLNVPMKLLYGKRPVNKDLLVTLDSRSCSCCSSCNRRLAVDCVTLCEESLHTISCFVSHQDILCTQLLSSCMYFTVAACARAVKSVQPL